jgi:hypothetical protein
MYHQPISKSERTKKRHTSMNELKKEAIRARALSLVNNHLELLNEGDIGAARQQLFVPPGITQDPLDIYVKAMYKLAPFQVMSISASKFEDVRQKRHGKVATIWVEVVVHCSLGEKSAEIAVWWFPESDMCQISARPSHWISQVLE